jgi:hypothetical protein
MESKPKHIMSTFSGSSNLWGERLAEYAAMMPKDRREQLGVGMKLSYKKHNGRYEPCVIDEIGLVRFVEDNTMANQSWKLVADGKTVAYSEGLGPKLND